MRPTRQPSGYIPYMFRTRYVSCDACTVQFRNPQLILLNSNDSRWDPTEIGVNRYNWDTEAVECLCPTCWASAYLAPSLNNPTDDNDL